MNEIKHQVKACKKNTYTKLVCREYAIIDENGNVKGTNNTETAIQELNNGKQVFEIKTFQMQITIKEQLKKQRK